MLASSSGSVKLRPVLSHRAGFRTELFFCVKLHVSLEPTGECVTGHVHLVEYFMILNHTWQHLETFVQATFFLYESCVPCLMFLKFLLCTVLSSASFC